MIGLRLALVVLYVYSRVSWPGGPVDPMARSPIPCFSEIVFTNLAQIVEANTRRVLLHAHHDIVYGGHVSIVSIMIRRK